MGHSGRSSLRNGRSAQRQAVRLEWPARLGRSLAARRAGSLVSVARPGMKLARVNRSMSNDSVSSGELLSSDFKDRLRHWLPSQRWFAGKARQINGLEYEVVPLDLLPL